MTILYRHCALWLINLPCVCICKDTACMYVIVSIKRLTIPGGMSVVICTDLWGKELHRQIGVGMVVISGILCGVMVSTLTRNAQHVRLNPTLGTIFPIFITRATILWELTILYRFITNKKDNCMLAHYKKQGPAVYIYVGVILIHTCGSSYIKYTSPFCSEPFKATSSVCLHYTYVT